MKKLELSIDREIEFMIKYELTSDELFIMKLIWFAQDGHPEYFSKFFSQAQLGNSIIDLLTSLQNKGIINQTYKIPEKGEGFLSKINDVDFNKNVLKSFMQHSQDLGMELFENYPAFTTINGRVFSLRNITKLYHSLDEMCWAYGKSIKWNPAKHLEVLEILDWAKETNNLQNGICAFIEERQWEMLEQVRNGETDTFNTYELANI